MRVLHTADWHLGKKLNSVSRLEEQRAVLDEIAAVADENGVDVIICAGDVFDTSVASAEAEELFYESCVRLAKNRVFIALAGNHDDPLRLGAPSEIAKALNVFLVGGYDNNFVRKNISGGNGYIKIEKGGQILNIAVMPYPQHSRLSDCDNRDKPYAEIVKNKLEEICAVFKSNEFNMIASHLFLTMSGKSENLELTDERELGTAAVLPSSILPQADYTALGHIHKPMTVSQSKNIYYSGSILSYSFDDISEKSVILVDFALNNNNEKKTTVKRIALKEGRRLMKVKVDNFADAIDALKENERAFVQIEYNGSSMLTLSEVNELKKQPSFSKIINNFIQEQTVTEYKERSEEELFIDFYKRRSKTLSEPKRELVDMFLCVMNGEDIV